MQDILKNYYSNNNLLSVQTNALYTKTYNNLTPPIPSQWSLRLPEMLSSWAQSPKDLQNKT